VANRYRLEEIAQPVIQVGAALLPSIHEIITQKLHKLSATKKRISSVKCFNLKCFNLKKKMEILDCDFSEICKY